MQASTLDRRADLAAALRDVQIFSALDDRERATIVDTCTFRRVPGGVLLCEQGSAGTELFIVLTGRLRALRRDGDNMRVLGEIGRGELVGEIALMTDSVRTADVQAVRDTVVAVIDKTAFDALVARVPRIVKQIAGLMVERLSPQRSRSGTSTSAETLCLVPAGAGPVDMADFAGRLARALRRHGPVAEVSSETIAAELGGTVHADESRLAEWLTRLEPAHRFVVYVADPGDTPWTRLCLRHADLVLRVANGAAAPHLSDVEDTMTRLPALRASQQLILVHSSAVTLPSGTRRWLDARPGLARHLHLREGHGPDFARLARMLTGTPHGLVLGGGGARGFAHVGVFQALTESGFAVDMAGGTSIGSAFAALIAMGLSPEQIVEACKVFGEEKVDYTLPVVALSGGFGLAAAARKLFRDVMIEDLWLPFFAVTTNLTQAKVNVHYAGPLAKWVRASCSLPGALPPVFDGNELHADGCVMNNLPVGVMREHCRGPIVAVDIDQSVDISTTMPYHEGISGWRMLVHKLKLFGDGGRVPILPHLFHRALMIASAQNAAPARALADLFLNPPVKDCGVFDWKKGPRVMADASAYAAPHINAWQWPGR